ncbi:MAG: SDR family oxidoreductase [bacterium]|nr:SDR family oxidoreductase [bacterium]
MDKVKTQNGHQEVVLITGCSSGLGRKLAMELKKRGYLVAASARNVDSIKDLAVDMILELDVTDDRQITSGVQRVVERFGRIDMLVNNAGYSVRAAVEEIDLEKLQQMFDVNVFGIIRMIQAVAPYMRKQMQGKIINVGSVSGRLCGLVNGGYCASKHSFNAISESARYELQSFGIQVTLLEPGAMDTDFFKTLSAKSDQAMKKQDSPYFQLYSRDLAYRQKQTRADIDVSVEEICRIISRKKLKTRYRISLPFMFTLLIHMPDCIREKLILKFN